MHSSGPKPSFSMTPGRNPSNRASAFSTSLRTASRPSADFKSSRIDRLPRRVQSLAGSSLGTASLSTQTTSAPRSASIMPQNGPGPSPETSTIFSPSSGPKGRPPVDIQSINDDIACDVDDESDNGFSSIARNSFETQRLYLSHPGNPVCQFPGSYGSSQCFEHRRFIG